jgi:hypothetical protein
MTDAPAEPPQPAPPEVPENPAATEFYGGAERRIGRIGFTLSTAGVGAAVAGWGPAVALGFALGAIVGLVNLVWLKRVAAGFTGAVLNDPKRPSTARLVFRYFVRFALITLGALVIFKRSTASGYGFLAGLFVPVAALMCEAAYEAFIAVRRNL